MGNRKVNSRSKSNRSSTSPRLDLNTTIEDDGLEDSLHAEQVNLSIEQLIELGRSKGFITIILCD